MKTTLTAAILMAAFATSAYAQTLVTVNGEKIDSSAIDTQVQLITEQSKGQVQDSQQLRAGLLNRMVTQTLVNQEAKKLQLEKSAAYKDALEKSRAAAKQQGADKQANFKQQFATYERDLLSDTYMYHVVSQNPATEADAQKFYNDYQARYKGTDEVKLSEIFVANEADAKAVTADLKKGQSFADVAKAKSIDGAAKQTGGVNPRYMPLKDLQESAPLVYGAVAKLKKGQYSQAVSAQNVWAVFKVDDKRAVDVPEFAKMKPAILNQLNNERINNAIGQLYQNADIKQ
ncbi:peptidyl-prolyl cis-trans isomerase [Vitreoscilla massiliensis]|uniref:peptidylprolyl isomerase n=1 Tax=Vitreoscilla massiliensis TaxID=1689272 RepID=A0ABY4DXT2_9NEIS|nr:peptidyl-prolyl cis-trans isomerase [Vitreoscilla massiliensis]UOO88331.1 peptidyl-prolyl cis-trans isomerase [Vitreoscilla massiliensis]